MSKNVIHQFPTLLLYPSTCPESSGRRLVFIFYTLFFSHCPPHRPAQTHTIEMSVIMLGDSHCHLLSITLPPALPQDLVTSCSDHVVIILPHSHLASPHYCFQFNPFTIQFWLYHSLAPNLMSLLFPKGGLNPLDLYSKPYVCSPVSPCSVLSPTVPNRKHIAPVPFPKAYLKVLVPCPLHIHFPHLKCPSSSYLHLEILPIF